MEFIRRNINKKNRNGTVYIGSSLTLPTISNVDITKYQGNFLPATDNGDGSFTVDASNVIFTGEISAFGAGTSSGGGGGSVTIVDNLTSTATDAELIATLNTKQQSVLNVSGTAALENADENLHNKEGVLLDAMVFGGRDAHTKRQHLL